MTDKIKEITFDSRDEYQRKPIAEKIIRLLESDAKVSPMVIDGGWGTGKTEFCHKLINLIETGESEFKAVYVDAFSADHADEPLMTLLAAILKLLPEADRPSLIKKALPAVRFGIKTTLKAGVSWALKQDAADIADDFEKDIQKGMDTAINHSVEALLTDHVAAEKSIATLKEALKELAKGTPIVIFIDELDRCRPNFSLSMLESIKHVFEVEGVQFVLVTNTEQLLSSISHSYGSSINAKRYLDKFLGFSFMLPKTYKSNGHELVFASVSHLKHLLKQSKLLTDTPLIEGGTVDYLEGLVFESRLSLREVETFVLYLEIYQSLTDSKGLGNQVVFGYLLLRVLGVFIFCQKPYLGEGLIRGSVNGTEIARLMGKSSLFDLSDESRPDYGDILTAIVGFESNVNVDDFKPKTDELLSEWNQIIDSLFQNGVGRPSAGSRVKIVASVIEVLQLGA